MPATVITDSTIITLASASPTGFAIIGRHNKKGRVTITNDDSTNFIVIYTGGGDPNNLPNGWAWDKSAADRKLYINKGESIDLPNDCKNFVAKADTAPVTCRVVNHAGGSN